MNDGALIDGVVRVDDLWTGEVEEGINGDKNNTNGVVMDRASPLKIVVSHYREGGSNVSLPEGREGSIVGLVN